LTALSTWKLRPSAPSKTAGLQLLDQWRGSVVVKQFSRSLSLLGQNVDELVLDALVRPQAQRISLPAGQHRFGKTSLVAVGVLQEAGGALFDRLQ
jgi:hypothetical protein